MDIINQNARELRKNMTTHERKLWNLLKNKQFYGFRFRRQYPIEKYIVDFICREKRIIVEIDGGQHNIPKNINDDLIRDEFLKSQGYTVIRFWNNDIDNNIEGVYKELQKVFKVI